MFFRVRAVLAPLLAVAALLLLASISLNGNRASVRDNNVQSMDAYLQVVEKLILHWQDSHLHNVESLSQLSWVQRWAKAQLALPAGQALRNRDYEQLQQIYQQQGYQGYALFDGEMRLHDDSNQGMQQHFSVPPAARDVLARAMAQGAAMSTVLPAPLQLRGSSMPAGTPMYLVCVNLVAQSKLGVLCLHFDQSQGIDTLLSTVSDPFYGQVFAVQHSGRSLGRSALDLPLSGHDLSGGYREPLPQPDQPAYGRLLRWSEPLQLGLLLQTPIEQLYAPYFKARQLVVSLLVVAVLLIVALSSMAMIHRRRVQGREGFYRQVLDQLPAQVRIRDVQGKLLLSNQLAKAQSHAGDLPLTAESAQLPAFSQYVWQLLREVLSSHQQGQVSVFCGELSQPDFEAWLLMGFPIFDQRGRLQALGSLLMDQSAQAHDQRALSALTRDLERQVSQRTAELALARDAAEAVSQAKAAFLANMSHEIRSPLNAVIGLAHLAERNARQPRNQDYLRRILKSAQYLQELINNILDLSKLEASKLQLEHVAFSPARMLESVNDMLWQKAHHKQLELVCDLDPQLPQELYGDPLRISQILLNLADNAIKFTAQGTVAVRIRVEACEGELWHLCFEVQDSGIGIAAQRLEDIFRPFEQVGTTTPRYFGGTGLGLAISTQLAQLMDGQLKVKSQPGLGSLFSLNLALEGVAQSHTTEPLGRVRRALVVDEQRLTRQRLVQLLMAQGFETDHAKSASHALDLLKNAQTNAQPYDVLLVDIGLKDRSAAELLSWLNRAGWLSHTEAVLLKPSSQEIDDEPLLKHVSVVLDTPVSARWLREALARVGRPAMDEQLLGRHVLLAEDERITQEVACELLQALGIRVTLASNGREALACLTADSSIELVLMDIQMPELDGLHATQLLRIRYPDLPVIALTGNSLSGDREQCMAAGMDDYLAKPIDPRELARTLNRWLRPAATETVEVKPVPAKPAPLMLNRSAALERLLGNERLYESLLQRFTHEYRDCAEQLQQLLEGADWTAAIEVSHRLKSVASTIGAECLAAQLDTLEQELRSGRPASQDTTQIAEQLRLVLEQICTLEGA